MADDETLLKVDNWYHPPQEILKNAHISPEAYEKLYKESIDDPEGFWARIADEELEWFQKWDKVFEWNHPYYQWFVNGKINITHNCLDRHVRDGKRNKVAYIYTNEKGDEVKLTYGELLDRVNRFSNALKAQGVGKGDRVAIYMPLTLEQIIAMLACARIGAIHSVVYAGFSAQALKTRIDDADAKLVVCSSWTRRRGKKVDLKSIVDEAVDGQPSVKKVIVAQREGDDYGLFEKEVDFHELMQKHSPECEPEKMDSEDPLYILYTSGTTGKPKGVVHTHGGYNLFTHYTTKLAFDLHDNDIHWCTADTGWVTGHSYIVYGPLSTGVTSLIFEGAPDHPDPGIFWRTIDHYRVTTFYTAPTAIRMFMKFGESYPHEQDLSSLRVIGSVGEPINPEAWVWYHDHIGKKQAAVIDTWWQTETGGHMLLCLPSCKQKPGKSGLPFFGVKTDVVDKEGNSAEPEKVGFLAVREPWPAALRNCWNQPDRYEQYWENGYYFAGDLATKDQDGYIMILGRSDDVLTVAGHRIGTAEVESALVSHPSVAEAAVIGKPDEIKGQSIKGFVILKSGSEFSDDLMKDMQSHVRKELGSLAVPKEIEAVDKLPKTRSGKIMRRVLKAQETGEEVGDTSTLED